MDPQSTEVSQNQPPKSAGKKKLYIIVGIVIVVIVIAILIYTSMRSKVDPQAEADKEATDLVAAVGKLIVLPEGVPVVATVADLEKLKGQPFFAKAKVGDKVLLYPSAGKAYLYDPVANKLLEVEPLTFDQNPEGAATTPNP